MSEKATANRERVKEIAGAIRADKPLAGCSYYEWGGSLYYGDKPEEKTSSTLRGLHVRLIEGESFPDDLSDDDVTRFVRRIARILNKRDERRVSAATGATKAEG